MKIIIVLVIFTYFSEGQKSQSECPVNTYFDTTKFDCLTCWDQNSFSINQDQCICSNGYNETSINTIGFRMKNMCSPCTDCVCSNSSQISIKYQQNGGLFQNQQCVSCSNQSYPSQNHSTCIPCQHFAMIFNQLVEKCICKNQNYTTAGDTCVSNIDIALLPTKSINSLLDLTFAARVQFGSTSISSSLFSQLYIYNAVGCYVYLDVVSCQALSNLCVFQIYDKNSIVCQLYLNLLNTLPVTANDPGQRNNLPWLYYQVSPFNTYYDAQLQMIISFDSVNDPSVVNVLPYYLATYNITGELISFKPLASELILCPHSLDDAYHSKQFGVNMKIDCTIDLQPYLKYYTTYTYEIYIKDTDGTFKPIPILMKDYPGNGSYPNRGTKDGYQFTRRFFIIDNIVSKEGDYNRNTDPSFIRYPSSILFNIRLHKYSVERMYIPFVEITYGLKAVQNGQIVDPYTQISFYVQNNFEPVSFWSITTILFIVYNILIGIIWLIRIYVWTKGNPRRSFGLNYSQNLFFAIFRLAIDTWNDSIFYFLFFFTGYWFVFYKLQSKIYILIPSTDDYVENYQPFDIIFYIMFAFRILSFLHLLIKQSSIYIYFIDWERTQIYRPKDIDEEQEALKSSTDALKSKTSCWRTLLVANEFAELQSIRTVSVEWTLIIFGAFMIGSSWEQLSSEQPTLSSGYQFVPNNYVLKYFIVQFVYLIIGLVQIIGKKILNIWFPYPVEDFIDLCSIANISIFLIDDNLHGYYLHGENPFGFSEGPAEHLQTCLKNEQLDKGKRRGLLIDRQGLGSDQDLQTFELYIPISFKQKLQNVQNYYKFLIIKILDSTRDVKNQLTQKEQLELQRFEVNLFLKKKIKEVQTNAATNVFSKEPFQRFFNVPPDDIDMDRFRSSKLPLFFKDPDFSFKQIFFCGYEYYLLVTDLIILNFWLIITNNLMIAILLQYASTKFFEYLKENMSEANLSERTLIDSRFLI